MPETGMAHWMPTLGERMPFFGFVFLLNAVDRISNNKMCTLFSKLCFSRQVWLYFSRHNPNLVPKYNPNSIIFSCICRYIDTQLRLKTAWNQSALNYWQTFISFQNCRVNLIFKKFQNWIPFWKVWNAWIAFHKNSAFLVCFLPPYACFCICLTLNIIWIIIMKYVDKFLTCEPL